MSTSSGPRPGDPASPADLVGETFDGLSVRGLLGRGGMASVYKAWDASLDRFVAVKIASAEDMKDREFAARFEREARAASEVSHPNVAHVYATGRLHGRPYYVMEYVEGRSLADLIDTEGRLAGLRGVDYLRQAAEGLRAAAAKGVIHRDIKPDNLMVDGAGAVKIVDFGLARRVTDARLTQTSMVVGTPRYMSPEQAMAEPLDLRSDLYSLGACFYHLFAGEPPFDADTPVALLMKHVHEPLVPLRERAPSVPPAVAAIVERMLAKRREDRYQTYEELLADLDAARRGRPLAPGVPSRAPNGVPNAPRSWVGAAAIVGILVVGVVAFPRTGARGPAPAPAAAPASAAPPPPRGFIGLALQTKTLANLRKLSTACQVWLSQNDEAPESLAVLAERFEIPEEERRDGWARPFRYERTSRTKYRVSSDGADGRPGTADDLVIENGLVVQGAVPLPGVPTLRQQRGLDAPPPTADAESSAPPAR